MGPDAPDTVTDALRLLEAAGYTVDFNVHGTIVHCAACGADRPLAGAEVERLYRFEGPSDPADEAIVLGLRCPACGARGTLASAFGPDADPDLLRYSVLITQSCSARRGPRGLRSRRPFRPASPALLPARNDPR